MARCAGRFQCTPLPRISALWLIHSRQLARFDIPGPGYVLHILLSYLNHRLNSSRRTQGHLPLSFHSNHCCSLIGREHHDLWSQYLAIGVVTHHNAVLSLSWHINPFRRLLWRLNASVSQPLSDWPAHSSVWRDWKWASLILLSRSEILHLRLALWQRGSTKWIRREPLFDSRYLKNRYKLSCVDIGGPCHPCSKVVCFSCS